MKDVLLLILATPALMILAAFAVAALILSRIVALVTDDDA